MIVALVYGNFRTSIYESGDMTHRDGYLTGPMSLETFSILMEAC